jgi:hypothetical protein
MTPSKARSPRTDFTATIVFVFAASLVGCASIGPLTPVAVSDVKSVAGTWEGAVYQSGMSQSGVEPDHITLTIREDGSYDVVSRQTYGTSRGKGRIVISEGRLILQGEKGRGVGTLSSNPSGDRVMNIEATLSDNRLLTAKLWPSH